MMISTQTICMSSSRIPQLGICRNSPVSFSSLSRPGGLKWSSSGFRKGLGHSTLAINCKQASSFSSSAEDASDDAVPANEIGVHVFTGTKNVELMDALLPAKLVSTVDDELPSLLSMVIDGFPPVQLPKYVHEAEKYLQQYVKRYEDVNSLDSYFHAGLSFASYVFPGVINVDRLVALSINMALLLLLDDFLFDTPNEFHHDDYGINQDTRESPQKIQEYLDYLDAVFSQQVQPHNPTSLIETLMWESGRDMLELSNLEWFGNYVASVIEYHRACVIWHTDIVQGHNSYVQDLESYTIMRAENSGAKFCQLAIEFANNSYIPSTLRTIPYFENITMIASIHISFVNDVFSYYKESLFVQNTHNLIRVLMECEGTPFVQTVHRAISLVNAYALRFMDLESEAWNSSLQNHLQNIKALIVGNVYFSFMDKRYRHPDSIFLEQRDMTCNWKLYLHAKGPKL